MFQESFVHQPAPVDTDKQPRVRSVAYPSNTISHCVSLTERINKHFGNIAYVPREKISKNLEISDSHLQTQLSSCVQYGLLEMKPKEGYKPTPLFTKIYKPLPTENRLEALKQCFFECDLYKAVLGDCKGNVLTQDGLATILYRNHKVSEPASPVAAKVFLENATELRLIGEDNILCLDGIQEAEVIELETPLEPEVRREDKITYLPPASKPEQKKEREEGSDVPPIPIFLDGEDRVAKLYMPKGFTQADLVRVSKILKAYAE